MHNSPMTHSQRHRQRGTVYVMVLVTAMLTTLIGLSGLLVMRVERRSSRLTNDTGQARNLAIAAADMGVYQIVTYPNWRNWYTHDVWSSRQALGEGSIQFKFVDHTDGVLDDNTTDPVTIIGKAELGDSVIMFSVAMTPDKIVAGSWQQVVE